MSYPFIKIFKFTVLAAVGAAAVRVGLFADEVALYVVATMLSIHTLKRSAFKSGSHTGPMSNPTVRRTENSLPAIHLAASLLSVLMLGDIIFQLILLSISPIDDRIFDWRWWDGVSHSWGIAILCIILAQMEVSRRLDANVEGASPLRRIAEQIKGLSVAAASFIAILVTALGNAAPIWLVCIAVTGIHFSLHSIGEPVPAPNLVQPEFAAGYSLLGAVALCAVLLFPVILRARRKQIANLWQAFLYSSTRCFLPAILVTTFLTYCLSRDFPLLFERQNSLALLDQGPLVSVVFTLLVFSVGVVHFSIADNGEKPPNRTRGHRRNIGLGFALCLPLLIQLGYEIGQVSLTAAWWLAGGGGASWLGRLDFVWDPGFLLCFAMALQGSRYFRTHNYGDTSWGSITALQFAALLLSGILYCFLVASLCVLTCFYFSATTTMLWSTTP